MKQKFEVYFEMFGKRMKTEVLAEDEAEARYLILGKVVFHKIETAKQTGDEVVSNLRDMFGMS